LNFFAKQSFNILKQLLAASCGQHSITTRYYGL